MAIQQLTQPIINPISAFDSTRAHTISFVVIGGAQVIGNRLVISDNETGEEIYNKIQSTMKLEHVIPANTLTNGGYYNAVVYTIDSANNESVASTPVPFYCYSQPNLTIDNIPATETIENGTYKFVGNYLQQENELLNSYQYTLYDSNKNVLSQSALIYYDTDSSLSYTFVGMSNDTAYYIELSGETINGTKITSGLKYFTVRYIQPASFAICDLVNNCEDGYIQISSNIVAIDGKSNPDPPIYIDDKEVDLRDPDSWVEWNSGFRIQDDFTMRVWGRDFNDYQNIITLTNDINATSTPNRIELKWMIGDVIKTLPSYTTVEDKSINILDAEAAKIQNLSVGGNLEQKTEDEIDFGTDKYLTINTDKSLPLQINVLGNSEHETRSGKNYLNTLAKYKAGDTVTIEGITYTFNDDGSITLNGTASATANSNLDFSVDAQKINGTNKKIVGLLTGSQVPSKMALTAYTSTWGANPMLIFSEVNKSLTINMQSNEEYTIFRISVYSGTTVNNQTVYYQILDTSETDLTYEQYGVSPSPDYPSEIKTVGSNENLLENKAITQTVNGVTFTVNKDGSVTANGTASQQVTLVLTKVLSLQKGDYMISGCPRGGTTATYRIDVWKSDWSSLGFEVGNGTKISLSESIENAIVGITITKGTTVENMVFKPKIEKGTVVTPYSKYGQGCVKVTICNEMLYNKDTMTLQNGLWANNTSRVIQNNVSGWYIVLPINGGKKYRITKKNAGLIGGATTVTKPENGVNLVDKFDYKNSITSKEIQTSKSAKYLFIGLFAGTPTEEQKISIIEGLKVVSEDYQEQSYILPIQQEMLEGDLFTQGLNKKEIHTWGKKIFNGAENIRLTTNGNSFALDMTDMLSNTEQDKVPPLISNYYKATSWIQRNVYNEKYSVSQFGQVLGFDKGDLTSVDDFKTWLKSQYDAGTPVIVYYKLKTPTSIDCTTEQSNVLDELNQSESYYPQTNIYTEENLALINAKYLGLPNPYNPSKIYSLGDIKNLIDIPAFNIKYNQQYFQSTNTNFILKPNFIYTLSFDYNVNKTSTDLYYSIGYGINGYDVDLKSNIQYQSLTKGRNSISFIVPENIPNNATLWIKFAQTIILADINVDISNIQLESGNISTGYEDPNLYNIYPTSASKNLFNYDSPVYLLRNNATYTPIQNGYNIKPTVINQDAYIGIGIKNVLNSGDIYTISFSQLGQFEKFKLYTTEKGSENIISEIPINNNSFVAPEGVYDLQLVFGVDSSNLSNYIEIWNIQIEANNVISEYKPYVSNSTVISLDEPLRGLGEYRDLICLESPNILNPETQSGIVKGNTTYYLNQAGNTQYHIWYYNEDGNLITFIDQEGHEASGITGIKGSFTTHKDCVKITITKSSNPDSEDITADELKTNQVGITKGDTAQVYYPYVNEPSVIRYIKEVVLTGEEDILREDTYQGIVQYSIAAQGFYKNDNIIRTVSNYFKGVAWNNSWTINNSVVINGSRDIRFMTNQYTTIATFKTFLKTKYETGEPIIVDYVLKTPVVTPLSEDNIDALKMLFTYKPISNVFTNNEVLGYLKLDYVSDYTEQQTQNAYVLLKCWNANSMPYICHSNYIDIPDEKDKVFIWMRRKNNLFDLKIENLGNYNEDDKPTDKTKPIVTLEINPNNVEATRIPVTAYSIDDNGLKTVRFSKDNGNTWDEIVNVDGLSSTNSYIFINLNPNTTYTIRVEAIDLAGNIGGISQQVTTKSS